MTTTPRTRTTPTGRRHDDDLHADLGSARLEPASIESDGWRRVAAASLVVAGVLLAGFTALEPAFHADGVRALESVRDAHGASVASHTMFTVAQLPLLLGLLAFVHVVRRRSPRVAMVTAILVALGGFGHMVYAGVSGIRLELAGQSDLERMGALLEDIDGGAFTVYAAFGLLGTVFGTILLATLAIRTRVAPRWVGPALVAFVAMEFFLSNAIAAASWAAGLLYAAALVALARVVWAARPVEPGA
jgi:hypothetical protein